MKKKDDSTIVYRTNDDAYFIKHLGNDILINEVDQTSPFGSLVAFDKIYVKKLNLNQITTLLSNIDDFSYIKAKGSGMDFFDQIRAAYEYAHKYGISGDLSSDEAVIAAKALHIKVKELFVNNEFKEKLTNLGASKADYAIVNRNMVALKEFLDLHKDCSSYELAKFFRLFNVGGDFEESIIPQIQEAGLMKEFRAAMFLKNEGNLDVKIEVLNPDKKTICVIIDNDGEYSWDYNALQLNYESVKKHFDVLVTFGNGAIAFSSDDILKVLEHPSLSQLKYNADFCLVNLSFHGSKDNGWLKDTVDKLPDDLAKNTTYYIQSCYGGIYHNKWEHKACLITATTDDAFSYSSINTIVENLTLFTNNHKITFANFIMNLYFGINDSTPMISGYLDGQKIPLEKLENYCERHYSNELELYNEQLEQKASKIGQDAYELFLSMMAQFKTDTPSEKELEDELFSPWNEVVYAENDEVLIGDNVLNSNLN